MPPPDQCVSWRTPFVSSGTSRPSSSRMPSFHASRTSFGAERPLDQPPLEVEAEDDVEAVRRLVRLDADETRLGAVDRRDEAPPGSTSPSSAGNVACSGSYQCVQNGRLRPTRFSQVRLCDSLRPSEGAPASGVRSSEERDAVRVQAVPGLVHRRPERVDARRLVARRQPDVAVRERGAERVDGRVEAPRAFGEARSSRGRARRTRAARPGRTGRPGTTRRPAALPSRGPRARA